MDMSQTCMMKRNWSFLNKLGNCHRIINIPYTYRDVKGCANFKTIDTQKNDVDPL